MSLDDKSGTCEHVVGFYRQEDALIAGVSEFLAPELDGGGAIVIIAFPAHRVALERALTNLGHSMAVLSRDTPGPASGAAQPGQVCRPDRTPKPRQ